MANPHSKLLMSLPTAGQHWGAWLERSARAAGHLTKAELARAVGVHRKSVQRWYADAVPPMESEHMNRLAKALKITTKELLAGAAAPAGGEVPAGVLPSEEGLRNALAAQLAAYARHLDLPQLLELVRAGALMARQGANEPDHVGGVAGHGTAAEDRDSTPGGYGGPCVSLQPVASSPARRALSSRRVDSRRENSGPVRGKP